MRCCKLKISTRLDLTLIYLVNKQDVNKLAEVANFEALINEQGERLGIPREICQNNKKLKDLHMLNQLLFR